ncbi:MAG: hypothetical protein ACJ786_06080 [Catenulispora sp.]
MTDTAKSVILSRLADEGFSGSYGALLFMTVLVGTDAETLEPESEEERHEWRGHLYGLRSALVCVVMHEAGVGPEDAAGIVRRQLEEAAWDLGRNRPDRSE